MLHQNVTPITAQKVHPLAMPDGESIAVVVWFAPDQGVAIQATELFIREMRAALDAVEKVRKVLG